ncbi:AI-2E family transporter [Pedobacter sp. SYSU D00535]|uniref:AI-2E family transporter n=1 Tax=Pedobacter sp. SYSU D00535 TaxID=2810308 RepID=UPI001A95F5B8|nr:AI-2E family transporter [Pedobacter sp. SYSU D00535]
MNRSVQILFLFFLFFGGLYFARAFLIPFTLAGIISMLLLPLSQKIESRGVSRPAAAFISLLVLISVVAGLIFLLGWQISGLAKDLDQMKQQISQFVDQIKAFLNYKLGISGQQQQKLLNPATGSTSGMSQVLAGLMSFTVDFVLCIVYIFIFLYFRSHLKKFILKLVPDDEQEKTETIIRDSTSVAHKYLSGLAIMIVMLWILYGIGFSIVGIRNAGFFAVLCGMLEIVPFVGNLLGTGITVLMALSQGGGGGMAIGVFCTYLFVQFVQSYIIEPMVVGSEVNLNPLFTIVALVLGDAVWGVAGLVMAIPLLGIAKIICDNVDSLKPFGFLIGEEKGKKENTFFARMKKMFKKDKP